MAPKWAPGAPGTVGPPIKKTLEFVMPERKKSGGAGPVLDKFRGVDFGAVSGPVGGHFRTGFGGGQVRLAAMFGLIWD